MKKKTVITTEKREVWLIHQLPADTTEEAQHDESEVLRIVPGLPGDIQSELPSQIQNEEE